MIQLYKKKCILSIFIVFKKFNLIFIQIKKSFKVKNLSKNARPEGIPKEKIRAHSYLKMELCKVFGCERSERLKEKKNIGYIRICSLKAANDE